MATTGFVFEKRWPQNAELFTANGTIDGKVTVASTTGFFVGQRVCVSSSTQESLYLQIKAIRSATELFLGPDTNNLSRDSKDRGKSIYQRTDLTGFTTAQVARIEANEQDRPNFPADVVIRAVYQEEPAVALRVLQVDKLGNPIDSASSTSDVNVNDGLGNDITSTVNGLKRGLDVNVIGGITIDNAEVNVELDATTPDGDSVRIYGIDNTATQRQVSVDPSGNVNVLEQSSLVNFKYDDVEITDYDLSTGKPSEYTFRQGGSLISTVAIEYNAEGKAFRWTRI